MDSVRLDEGMGHASSRLDHVVRALAWLVAGVALLNVLYFVLRATCPVFRDDDWYFLDVFLRKAIDGTLGPADFFVRRMGPDHSQPLFKLVLLAEWRYLGTDLTLGAVLGVIAAAASGLIYLRVLHPSHAENRRGSTLATYIAWPVICILLFSLSGGTASQWTWPLTALENITNLIILLFLLAVWHAHRTRRYALVIVATLFLGISSDDSALIAAFAGVLALLLMQLADPGQRDRSVGKLLAVVVACVVVARIGYRYAPMVGGRPSPGLAQTLATLFHRFTDQGWWKWVVYPLTSPVSYRSPSRLASPQAWLASMVVMALILIAAHICFWRRAFRGVYNRTIFIAVATMLVTYGWVAGIVLNRVSQFGNDYLMQPRYILLFSGQLIALLLMWAATRARELPAPGNRHRVFVWWIPAAGCFILLVLQIPASLHAWRVRPALQAYYATMARQIDTLARNPTQVVHCFPELPVCGWPTAKRVQIAQMLIRNRLNVFSPRMQALHSYLPRLQAPHVPDPAARIDKPDR